MASALRKPFLGVLLLCAAVAASCLSGKVSRALQAPLPERDWNARQVKRIAQRGPADGFRFAVMGDSRGGESVLRGIFRDMASRGVDLAIHTGDFVDSGRPEQYPAFLRTIGKCPAPLLCVIGNHEIIAGGREQYERIFGSPYWSFTHGDCLFVVLDDANEQDIGGGQMRWLRVQLARHYRHRFVFLHVPPLDPRQAEATTSDRQSQPGHCLRSHASAEEFMGIVGQHNVDAVLASHIHGYFDVVRGGVRYLISGGAGAELDGRDPETYFYHYLLVTVRGEDVRVEVRRVSPAGPSGPKGR